MDVPFPDVLMDTHGKKRGSGVFEDEIKQEYVQVQIPHSEAVDDLFDDDGEHKEGIFSRSESLQREESEGLSASELRNRKELEYEEEDGQDENVVELKHAVLQIPNIPTPRSSDGNHWVIKMPNFVKLDPKPYDSESYMGPEGTDGFGEKERSMSIKLEVENTIRWRWTKGNFGQAEKRSNSRIIRWSDGSLSLLLGKEIFDISQAQEGAAPSQSQNRARGAGLTYLVAQHKRPGILQVEAGITGQMSLRPTGMQSETHRKLARAVGQRHSRVARLRIAPEHILEQEQQEQMKAAQKKPRRTRAAVAGDDGFATSGRRRRGGYNRRRESTWSDEEPEAGTFAETDEEEEGDYDTTPRRKSRRSSGDIADSKRGAGEYQTDDFVVADSSEGEDAESDKRKRRSKGKEHSRHAHEDDATGEVDALDEIEARIERQEVVRRRKRTKGLDVKQEIPKQDEDVAMDMDIESEEDEEELNIRRHGTGSRKKRAMALGEDEDE